MSTNLLRNVGLVLIGELTRENMAIFAITQNVSALDTHPPYFFCFQAIFRYTYIR